MIKKLFPTFIALFFLITSTAWSANYYISQSAAGSGDASSCANAKAYTWNWASPSVADDDTVYVCGTITHTGAWGDVWQVPKGGSAGHPITIKFCKDGEASCGTGNTGLFTSAAFGLYGAIYIANLSYLVIDGNGVGIIQNTANGTSLANQAGGSGIEASGSHDIEVKNFTIQNLYVHTNTNTPPGIDHSTYGFYHCQTCGINQSIHDNVFSNGGWMVTLQTPTKTGDQNWNVYNNHFLEYCHGVSFGGNVAGASGVNVYNNHFDGGSDNWHTGVGNPDECHRDGVHLFHGSTSSISNVNFYNNLFDGDWGNQGTSYIFLEGYQGEGTNNGVDDVSIYNNVFKIKSGNYIPDGAVWTNASNLKYYNNTFIGGGAAVSGTCLYQLNMTGFVFKDNLMSSCDNFMAIPATTNSNINYNLYADGGTSLAFQWGATSIGFASFATWKTDIAGDGNSLTTADAKLNSDSTIQSTSPGKWAGTATGQLSAADKAGVSWHSPPSMGAYEYASGGFLNPPSNLRIHN